MPGTAQICPTCDRQIAFDPEEGEAARDRLLARYLTHVWVTHRDEYPTVRALIYGPEHPGTNVWVMPSGEAGYVVAECAACEPRRMAWHGKAEEVVKTVLDHFRLCHEQEQIFSSGDVKSLKLVMDALGPKAYWSVSPPPGDDRDVDSPQFQAIMETLQPIADQLKERLIPALAEAAVILSKAMKELLDQGERGLRKPPNEG